jgi:hypothetical protein
VQTLPANQFNFFPAPQQLITFITSQLHETSNNNAVGVEFNQRQMINNHEESEHEEEEKDDDEMKDFIEVTA